jgi:molybdate-binding protein/DNA-binding XRE family transcriptional regulator
MRASAVVNRVRELREQAGISQSALAAAIRLSRQSLGAIEAGRVTPGVDVGLRLAQALGRRVEELFGAESPRVISAEPGSGAFASGARVSLAEVRGRWVAHPLVGDDVRQSADGVVLGAKRAVRVEPLRSEGELRENVLIMGCAPALGVLAERLNTRRGAGRFAWLSRGSTEALEQLARERVQVAGVHLLDARTGEANVGAVRRVLAGRELTLVALARWQVGWVTAPGNPKQIRSALDLARRGMRLVAREPGAGARRWLDAELRRVGLSPALARSALLAGGHLDVARAVAFGAADTGVATLDAARAFGLELVPLGEERFDLVVPKAAFGDARVARLLDELSSGAARRELGALGYDTRCTGERSAELHAA